MENPDFEKFPKLSRHDMKNCGLILEKFIISIHLYERNNELFY